MKNNDAQLIQRVLDGDDTAFSALVKNISDPFMHLHGERSEISISLRILHKMRS